MLKLNVIFRLEKKTILCNTTDITFSMEHTHCKQAYITLKCASVFLWQFNWVEHTTEPLEIISDPTTPLNNLLESCGISSKYEYSCWAHDWNEKQKPVGVVWFRNGEVTRGQGYVWRVRDCLRLGQEPYGWQPIKHTWTRYTIFFTYFNITSWNWEKRFLLPGTDTSSWKCRSPDMWVSSREKCVCVCVLIMSYDLHFP